MLIRTRFDVGQEVFYYDAESCKIKKATVISISVNVLKNDEPEITYWVKLDNEFFGKSIPEASVFKNRDEVDAFTLSLTSEI